MPDPPHVEGVTHRYVEANGIRFHVAEAGAGDDPVLLLHGWPQHWYEWRHLIPTLAERHRVLALDLRGFGWSDAPRRGYEKESMATDVLAVLDALGIERVKLVGHDWGGWIGFLLCLRAPERFDRFLALGVVHPWQTFGRGLRQLPRFLYQLLIIAPGLGYGLHRSRVFIRTMLRGGTAERSTFDATELASFADNLAEPARARACVQVYRTFVFHDQPETLRGRYSADRLRTPTHLLLGDSDPVLSPKLLPGYEDHADAMTVEVVPRCGHFVADEHPRLVADRARDLFSGSGL